MVAKQKKIQKGVAEERQEVTRGKSCGAVLEEWQREVENMCKKRGVILGTIKTESDKETEEH